MASLEISSPWGVEMTGATTFELVIDWLSPEAGGRTSGVPAGPTYLATAVFDDGPEVADLHDQYSIRIELGGAGDYGVAGFLFPEAVPREVEPGLRLLIMEQRPGKRRTIERCCSQTSTGTIPLPTM